MKQWDPCINPHQFEEAQTFPVTGILMLVNIFADRTVASQRNAISVLARAVGIACVAYNWYDSVSVDIRLAAINRCASGPKDRIIAWTWTQNTANMVK